MYKVTRSKDFLIHHGIKGQEWGERRFQNEDGSLTPEGRERYGISEKRQKKAYAKLEQKIQKTQEKEKKYLDSLRLVVGPTGRNMLFYSSRAKAKYEKAEADARKTMDKLEKKGYSIPDMDRELMSSAGSIVNDLLNDM